jgi:exopolyphosphatase / guanosine-5'-triphosphate,3'-diphosphate pyrophosphatase
MNVAVIDLGTNTFHLLIVKVREDGTYHKLFKTKNAVKLGKGGITKNIIAPGPYRKGIETIKIYRGIIERYNVKKVFALGTSSIRSAMNGKEFIEDIREETGIQVKPISGEEEAEFICHGVWDALEIGDEIALIIDIGGGSIEFILADDRTMYSKQSYNIGVARLLEKFNPSDPITPEEVGSIEEYLETVLQPLFSKVKEHRITTVIGASGSFDSFAEMIAYRFNKPEILKRKTEYSFNLEEFYLIHEQLLKSTLEDRKVTKGIVAMRVDMIVLASVFVNYILKKLNITKMRLSSYALKEGVIAKIIKESAIYM